MRDADQFGRPRDDDQFGLCPTCRQTDGCLIVAGNRWFRCDRHRVIWFAGPDWAADLQMAGRGTDQQNRERMHGYKRVAPFFWNPP